METPRAFSKNPSFMLLNEPATFLDMRQHAELFETLCRLNREEHMTIGLVSHQIETAKDYVKTAVFMKNGRIVESGTAEQLLTRARLESFFEIANRKQS